MPVGGAGDVGHARSWLGRLAFAVGCGRVRAQLWGDFGERRVRRRRATQMGGCAVGRWLRRRRWHTTRDSGAVNAHGYGAMNDASRGGLRAMCGFGRGWDWANRHSLLVGDLVRELAANARAEAEVHAVAMPAILLASTLLAAASRSRSAVHTLRLRSDQTAVEHTSSNRGLISDFEEFQHRFYGCAVASGGRPNSRRPLRFRRHARFVRGHPPPRLLGGARLRADRRPLGAELRRLQPDVRSSTATCRSRRARWGRTSRRRRSSRRRTRSSRRTSSAATSRSCPARPRWSIGCARAACASRRRCLFWVAALHREGAEGARRRRRRRVCGGRRRRRRRGERSQAAPVPVLVRH